jgi:hypothetical protein
MISALFRSLLVKHAGVKHGESDRSTVLVLSGSPLRQVRTPHTWRIISRGSVRRANGAGCPRSRWFCETWEWPSLRCQTSRAFLEITSAYAPRTSLPARSRIRDEIRGTQHAYRRINCPRFSFLIIWGTFRRSPGFEPGQPCVWKRDGG